MPRRGHSIHFGLLVLLAAPDRTCGWLGTQLWTNGTRQSAAWPANAKRYVASPPRDPTTTHLAVDAYELLERRGKTRLTCSLAVNLRHMTEPAIARGAMPRCWA